MDGGGGRVGVELRGDAEEEVVEEEEEEVVVVVVMVEWMLNEEAGGEGECGGESAVWRRGVRELKVEEEVAVMGDEWVPDDGCEGE